MGYYKVLYETPQFIFINGYRHLLIDDEDSDHYQLYYCSINNSLRWIDSEIYYPKNARGLAAAMKYIGLLK